MQHTLYVECRYRAGDRLIIERVAGSHAAAFSFQSQQRTGEKIHFRRLVDRPRLAELVLFLRWPGDGVFTIAENSLARIGCNVFSPGGEVRCFFLQAKTTPETLEVEPCLEVMVMPAELGAIIAFLAEGDDTAAADQRDTPRFGL